MESSGNQWQGPGRKEGRMVTYGRPRAEGMMGRYGNGPWYTGKNQAKARNTAVGVECLNSRHGTILAV